MSFPDIRCFGVGVILKIPEKNEKTAGGIFVPDRSRDPDQAWICEVMATGPGHLLEDGSYEPLPFKRGDKILISKTGGMGQLFPYDGWMYWFGPAMAPNVFGVVDE
jgi:chaperonin GroES